MCIGRVLDDVWTTGRVIGMCIGRVLDDGLVNSHQLRSEQAPAKGQHRHQGYRQHRDGVFDLGNAGRTLKTCRSETPSPRMSRKVCTKSV